MLVSIKAERNYDIQMERRTSFILDGEKTATKQADNWPT